MNEPIRLLLADDHEVTRAGFAAMLADCPEFSIVGQAVDGRQALELCQRLNPDIAILDIRMPQLNGLATARLLHEQQPSIKVLLFTMYDSPDHLEAAVNAGAVGYLLKDASRQEVIDGLRQVAAGQCALNGTVSAQLLRRVVQRNQGGAPGSALTPREHQVLGLIAAGLTNREIGEELGIATGTAKAHVERVIGKLGVADRTQAAVQGIALGLVAPLEHKA
ncbi:two component LuxR family transcriptional regulator [Ectopseudomonas mendocina DLHK]|nr:two component LuxR family transcriptional regulator [Pseudomonas mendocina DLHK]